MGTHLEPGVRGPGRSHLEQPDSSLEPGSRRRDVGDPRTCPRFAPEPSGRKSNAARGGLGWDRRAQMLQLLPGASEKL